MYITKAELCVVCVNAWNRLGYRDSLGDGRSAVLILAEARFSASV